MKTKVYGKKSRSTSHAQAAFNASLTPEASHDSTRTRALREKSCNSKVAGRSFEDEKERLSPNRTQELAKNFKTSEQRSRLAVDNANEVEPHKESATAEKDLTNALGNLDVKDVGTTPPTKTRSLEPQKARPAPRLSRPVALDAAPRLSRSVALDAATGAYLWPLLSVKHVQPHVEAFAPWLAARCAGISLTKIGEGSFGEVYRASIPPQAPAPGGVSPPDTAILKLVPLNAPRGPNSKCFTAVAAAAAEVRMLQRVQRVPGFVGFRGACVLRGAMPPRLSDLWAEYSRDSGKSVASRDPRGKRAYPATQLWLLIEMADAGKSLEPGEYAPARKGKAQTTKAAGRYLDLRHTWDIWWQIVQALAKAEAYSEFEHRDLHLGNICAKNAPDCEVSDGEDLEMIAQEGPIRFPVHKTGIEVTIIDYTLSRAKFGSRRGNEEDDVLFYDFMSDDDLLNGEGHLQYDMYRYQARAICGHTCRDFVPATNVIWIHYILRSLMDVTVEPSIGAKATRDGLVTRSARMREALDSLLRQINPDRMDTWAIRSAGGLLDVAITNGWFSAEDIVGR